MIFQAAPSDPPPVDGEQCKKTSHSHIGQISIHGLCHGALFTDHLTDVLAFLDLFHHHGLNVLAGR